VSEMFCLKYIQGENG